MLWVCGQPHIPVVVGDGQQLQLQVYLHAEGLYTTEITNHCYTAKITLCSLVGDCRTPVSQHRALARVGY